MKEKRARLPELAVRALLYEVMCYPKPGLVDPIDTGSHTDMDVYTFLDSAVCLYPYFAAIVSEAETFTQSDVSLLWPRLQKIGLEAETRMFETTQGINTHKGSIFGLGCMLAACQYVQQTFSDEPSSQKAIRIQYTIQQLTQSLKRPSLATDGQKLYQQFKIGGAVAMAQSGYEIVCQRAIWFFDATTGPMRKRLLQTLLFLAYHVEDTTLIKRHGDPHISMWLRFKIERIFSAGGIYTIKGTRAIDALCRQFQCNNFSIGGCADLLVLTVFLHSVLFDRY